MASVDAESESVVVRIVYDGPPTAGKTTSLSALAQRFGQGQLVTPEATSDGRTLFFDWLEYVGGRFEGRPIRCQLVSVPGQKALAARRRALLETADAVVFVGDSTASGAAETQEHLNNLLDWVAARPGPPVGVVLQANKRDLPDALPLAAFRGQHGLGVIASVASRGEGIREAFVFAVRLALDRVRELVNTGALEVRRVSSDGAGELLSSLRSLEVKDEGSKPGVAVAAAPASTRVGISEPTVPDATIPSGWIWPPINGRILLQEATAHGAPKPEQRSPREWVATSASGWRFHSPAGGAFGDLESARQALIQWAQVHSSLSGWTSAHRCVALAETSEGFRLWQIVRAEPTLWTQVDDTLGSGDRVRLGSLVSSVAQLCARTAEHWARAPWELPCTLETVSAQDGTFASFMPETRNVRPTQTVDRRSRLWHQLESLLVTRLGPEGGAIAQLMRST